MTVDMVLSVAAPAASCCAPCRLVVWGRELSEEAERTKRREERRKKEEEDRQVGRSRGVQCGLLYLVCRHRLGYVVFRQLCATPCAVHDLRCRALGAGPAGPGQGDRQEGTPVGVLLSTLVSQFPYRLLTCLLHPAALRCDVYRLA